MPASFIDRFRSVSRIDEISPNCMTLVRQSELSSEDLGSFQQVRNRRSNGVDHLQTFPSSFNHRGVDVGDDTSSIVVLREQIEERLSQTLSDR